MRISLLMVMIVATFAAFAIWPDLDLTVTAAFYKGATFPVALDARAEMVRLLIWDLAILVALVSAAMLVASLLLRRPLLRLPARVWGLIVALFLLGPGLLVNGILKREWGRARPADTVNFGGTKAFTPQHDITDQCASNCSFVSGESAGAMALAIALWLILSAWRAGLPQWSHRVLQGVIVAIPLITALQRVAAGRHFLSDTLLASLFVALLAAILARIMLNREGPLA